MGKNMVAIDKARYKSCIYWTFRGTGVSRTVVRCTPNHASQPLCLDCSDCSSAIGSLHTQFAPNDLDNKGLQIQPLHALQMRPDSILLAHTLLVRQIRSGEPGISGMTSSAPRVTSDAMGAVIRS